MMQITRKRIQNIHASYTLEGTVFINVEIIKYLGVIITNDLQWNTRASSICTNRTLGVLRRNLYAYPREVKQAAYEGVGYEISTCQMQYDAADKKTDQEDPCFIYLGGN